MGTEALTENERKVVAAVATAGSIKQTDLKARFNLSLPATSRDRLSAAGLLRVRTNGTGKRPVYWLDPTEKGVKLTETATPPLASVSEGPRYGEAPYSMAERSILLTLMVLAAPVSVSQLKQDHGLTMSSASQKRFERDGLISVRSIPAGGRRKPTVTVELSDPGWAWAARELAESAPKEAKAEGRALYTLLGGLHRFLERNRLSLADVFGDAPLESAPPTETAVSATPANLDAQIRAAYRALCPFPKALVAIADVRERLGAAPRSAVDAALIRLHEARIANLIPNEDLKTITARDRSSAIRLGEYDRHLMVME